jgi:hypothetical protein
MLTNELFAPQVEDVVDERAADEKLHRQIIDPLWVFPAVGFSGREPLIGQQVPQRTRDGLKPLALAGIFQRDDVIVDQVSLVKLAILLSKQRYRLGVARLRLLRCRGARHGILTFIWYRAG